MTIFPVCLNVKQVRCLVVGAGEVAAHKIESLLEAEAQVIVVAPEAGARVRAWVEAGRVVWHSRRFADSDLDETALVIAATDDDATNAGVAQAAAARRIPVNVVDNPALCSFIMPSVIRRGPLVISLSSSGNAPVLLRQLKAALEAWLPDRLGEVAAWAGRWRAAVKQALPDVASRRRFWEQLLASPVAEKVLAGREDAADDALRAQLAAPNLQALRAGHVSLVGAGPGDAELLTLKALRCMGNADVVLYDALVTESVLAKVRKEAERIYVGKQCNRHALSQEKINELILEKAQQGLRVLRLKGGDPFVFGRGAEELDLLIEHGVSFEVVPGITSAQGAACYAGLPLTHRDHAHGVSFITGHGKNELAAQDWRALAASSNTLVFYMGVGNAAAICEALCTHGRDADTPAAIVSRATHADQRVLHCRLGDLPGVAVAAEVATPALILIGHAPLSQPAYQWFGAKAEVVTPATAAAAPREAGVAA